MNQKALDWANSLSRKQVSPLERDILKARAKLAGPDGASFASNHTLATLISTRRECIVRGNRSLIKKGLMVRATTPRFQTETRWFYLTDGLAQLGLSPSVLKDTRPHQNSVVVLGTKRLPYSEKIKKGLKTSSARSGIGVPNKLPKEEPIIPSKKEPAPRPFRPLDLPVRFWGAFPPSQRKRDKAETLAFFMRLKVQPDWFERRWLPAIFNATHHPNGQLLEEQYQMSPLKFLTGRRWTDGY